MTQDVLQQWLRRQPFVPFVIRMSNGDEYPVPHPEYAALSLTSVIVTSPDSVRYSECSLSQITSIEKPDLSEAGAGSR